MPSVLDGLATQTQLGVTPQKPRALDARDMGDVDAVRQRIGDNVLAAAQRIEPISNQRYTLQLGNVAYAGPDRYSVADQKNAILTGRTLDRRLRGEWQLVDNATGEIVDRRATTLAKVPYYTQRGTFILGGNEYTLANQMRLRSGVFARRKANGELESHVNVLPGKGTTHRLYLDPAKGVFRIQFGQAKLPLLPVLRAMGVTDAKLREAWGNDLAAANMKVNDAQVIDKLYQRLIRARDQDPSAEVGTKAEAVANALRSMELDPEVTKRTLGAPIGNVGPDALLAATSKLLRISRDEEDEDDRDALAFQNFMGPEDLLAERIGKDKGVLRQLLWKATARGNLGNVQAGTFTPAVKAAIMGSGLGQPLESINPAQVFEQQGRVSRMGVGGIPSLDAVPDEARNVQPSHFGFVDPLVTPECYDRQTEVMTRRGWVYWDAVTDADEFACLVDGHLTYAKASRHIRQPYRGVMYGAATSRVGYLVTPNHRLWVRPLHHGAMYRIETAADAHERARRVCSGGFGAFVGDDTAWFQLPAPTVRSNNTHVVDRVPIVAWAAFMGWWLGEGSCRYDEEAAAYHVKITQSRAANPENCDLIATTLRALPFAWNYSGSEFAVATKQLAAYLRVFGGSHARYIPAELLHGPLAAREALYAALMRGEGRRDRTGRRSQFCTTSKQLALDTQQLAFSLGIASRVVFEPDSRPQANHGGAWVVHMHKYTEHQIQSRGHRHEYFTVDFDDEVFSATVPGGLLYVRRGDTIGHWSGNSGKVGVDSRLSHRARKGNDGRVYAPFTDARTGQEVWKSPQDMAEAVIAFPGSLRRGRPFVAAMNKGKLEYVPREAVQFELPAMEGAFAPVTNMVPMKSAMKGQRVAMAQRMMTQALPLTHPEAPLVQSGVPGEDRSFEQMYADRMGAVRAKQAGTVIGVTDDAVKVRYQDGSTDDIELYSNFPYNRKTFLHQSPVVRPGQSFSRDDLLVRSNYTDGRGTAALGANARVAYVPYKGWNFEDAIVISEGFAKRMQSEHMYQHGLDVDDETRTDKSAFVSVFPSTWNKATLSTLDDSGVVKPGTVVKKGDPLVLAVRKKPRTHSSLHNPREKSFVDKSETWNHEHDGVVTDVAKTDKGVVVSVKSTSSMHVGDKLSGRYGDKGVIAKIVPDDQMPRGQDGRPYEVLANPLGVISRTNPAQMIEAVLGKIAEKTGEPISVHDFEDIDDLTEWAEEQLRKHGMTDLEDIIDGETERKIPGVFTGNRFFMKLHHTAECYDAQTEVLTARGWVAWPDVRDHDVFATVEDGRLIYEMAEEIVRKPYTGELCAFAGRYVDYAVTPNHRMYLERYHGDKGFQFLSAEHVHASRFKVQQFGFEPDRGEFREVKRLGDLEIPWDDFCELVGWWAAEGSTTLTSRKAYTVIYQSEAANPAHCQTIRQLFERLPVKWHEYRVDGELFGFATHNRDLAEYLHLHGTHCYNKRLPREVVAGPATGRRRVFDAMMAGDGNKQETETGPCERYSTTSKGLADDFQELAIRVGLGAIVRPDTPRKESHYLPSWTCGVALSRQIAQIDGDRRKTGFCRVPYAGTVYCATMRTGLLYVRRNGKPMLCGNSKAQGRGQGGYTAEGAPAKGGETGSKRVSLLDVNALLSHGATEVIRDASLVRGQQHPEYWRMLMAGHKPPTPEVPLVYRKFVNSLRGAGINVVRDGTRTNVMGLTNRDIEALAGPREITSAETVDWKTGLKPIKGGLFDEGLTGGHRGNRWSFIALPEPMPNPVMEEPIRRTLGLTRQKFLDVLAGKEKLHDRTGPQAIAAALGSLNLDREIERCRQEINSGRKTARDAAVRKLGYLKSAKRMGLSPRDWMLDKVPVIPPMFRPVSVMQGNGRPMVADPNFLYKEVFDASKNLKTMMSQVDDVGDERLAVYNAFRGVTGLGDPVHPKNKERQVKGLLKHVFGSSPKLGVVQRKLLGSTTDLVGRAVISPNPDLDLDDVGIPENRAWEIYQPFIVRSMVRAGVPRHRAVQEVKTKSPLARQAMLKTMDSRPVIINRAPVLHRYGMMAFRPRLVKDDTMHVNPFIVGGFGADFDGDAMQFHVPSTDEAAQEAAEKMLPSRNLLSPANFKAHQLPSKEFVGGLYSATARVDKKRPPKVFRTKRDAIAAYRRGEIDVDRQVQILET